MSDKQNKAKELPNNIDILLPVIESFTRMSSVRAKNALYRLIQSNNNSLKEWDKTVSSSTFSVRRVRNVGEGTATELDGLIMSVKGYLDSFTNEKAVVEALERYSEAKENANLQNNTKVKRQIIVESIIREANRPVSFKRLYKEFRLRCPDEKIKESTFRYVISECANVLPIGRSSTFTLREWTKGTARGGATRDIVYDYLSSLDSPIAPLDKVAKAVRKHRPKTTSSTLVSNLKNDRSGQFCVYFFKGEKYLGLKGAYPEDYFPWTSDAKSAEVMSINYPKLKKFITTKKRFPFSTEPGEEGDLGAFWDKQNVLYTKNKLDTHARKYHKAILTEFGNAMIPKEEYEWGQMLKKMTTSCKSGNVEAIDNEAWVWFAKTMVKHTRGELDGKKQQEVIKLLQLIKGSNSSKSN